MHSQAHALLGDICSLGAWRPRHDLPAHVSAWVLGGVHIHIRIVGGNVPAQQTLPSGCVTFLRHVERLQQGALAPLGQQEAQWACNIAPSGSLVVELRHCQTLGWPDELACRRHALQQWTT